jgi:hypothetical protein
VTHMALDPLVRPFAESRLTEKEQGYLAAAAIAPLVAAWQNSKGDFPTDPRGVEAALLALGVTDRILMLEHSIYSVISPEGAASILWHDPTRARDAATNMRITAQDLLELKVIEGIIAEPILRAAGLNPARVRIYIVDSRDKRIRAVRADGVIDTIAGKDSPEYGDPTEDVPATDVYVKVYDLAVDDAGTVYLSSQGSIQAIGPDGIITKLSDNDAGASALALDGAGNLYFSQRASHQVSVLPRVDEDAAPVAAEQEADTQGTPWPWVIIGVLLAAGVAAAYPFLRRRRASRESPSSPEAAHE